MQTSSTQDVIGPVPHCGKCHGTGVSRDCCDGTEGQPCPCLTLDRGECEDCGRFVYGLADHALEVHADYGLTPEEREELRQEDRRKAAWVRETFGPGHVPAPRA